MDAVWNLEAVGQNRFGEDVCNLYRDRELMAEYLMKEDGEKMIAKLNSHAALVAALKLVLSVMDTEVEELEFPSVFKQARAALTLAGEQA